MLENGAIADSAVLPSDAVQEQPIELAPEAVLQSIHNTQELPIQLPEEIMAQQDMAYRGQRVQQTAVHYHPIEVSGIQLDTPAGLRGLILPCTWTLLAQLAIFSMEIHGWKPRFVYSGLYCLCFNAATKIFIFVII